MSVISAIRDQASGMYQYAMSHINARYESYLRQRDREFTQIASSMSMGHITKRYYEFGAAEQSYRRVVVCGAVVSIVGRSWFGFDWRAIACVGAFAVTAWGYNCVQRRFALALGQIRYRLEMMAQEEEMRASELARRNAAILDGARCASDKWN